MTRIKEILSRVIFYTVLELIALLTLFTLVLLKVYNVMEVIFNAMFIEIVFKVLLDYMNRLKEIFLIHVYDKKGKKFNKEYFELYSNTNIVRVRFLVFFEYISCMLFSAIYNVNGIVNSKEVLTITIIMVVFFVLCGFVAWIVFMWGFLHIDYNRKLERLISIKKDNFDAYTKEEKDILES